MDTRNLKALGKAMEQNGVKNPTEIILGLLWLLGDNHRTAIGADLRKNFHDGLDGLTGKHAISLADSLANLTAVYSAVLKANAKNPNQNPQEAQALEIVGTRLRCLSDLISELLPGWKMEGEQMAGKMMAGRFQIEMLRNDSEEEPPKPPSGP